MLNILTPLYYTYLFIRLASLGGGPQAHVHMEGKKYRVLYLNLHTVPNKILVNKCINEHVEHQYVG